MSAPKRSSSAAAASWLGALSLLLGACADRAAVLTYEVVPRDFAHRVTAEGVIRAAEVTPIVVPPQVRHGGRILWMAEDGAEIEQGQAVMRLDHYDLEQRLEAELAELRTAEVQSQRARVEGRSAVASATTTRDLAVLELVHAERFRRADASVFSRAEILDSEIAEQIARTRQGYAEELELVQADRARAQVEVVEVGRREAGIEVDRARAALAALELRAPRRGILLWARDWRGEIPQIGADVVRGQLLGEIPDLARAEAEVFVLEADAAGVEPGKLAEITIEAHPERVHPARVGRVDPVTKRRIRGSPVQYLGVTLAIDAVDPAIMKPGQRLIASIVLDEQAQALVIPRPALFVEDGDYFVYVRDGDRFVRRPVEVRTLGPSLVPIEHGLAEGDVVALEAPPTEATFEQAGEVRR